MATVLVTGAFGNIGQFIIDELLKNGHQVLGLDKPNPSTTPAAKKYDSAKVTALWCDIRDEKALKEAVDKVDAVIHVAAIIPPLSETEKALATAINVDATRSLVQLMEASKKTKRLVFASSMGIFGKIQNRQPPLRVGDTPTPDDHYGQTKVNAEAIISASTLEWTILRLTASPPVNLASARSHKGNNPFDFHPDARVEIVHPADAGCAFARAIDVPATIGKIFFIGGGERCRLSHYDLANGSLQAAGLRQVKRDVFKNTGQIEMYGDWVDTDEVQALLKFQNHSAEDFFKEFRASFGVAYYFVKLISPLATWVLVKQNGYKN